MGKSKQFDPSQFEGKKIKEVIELGNGYSRITFDDGTSTIVQFVPLEMTVVTSKGKGKKEEPEEEEGEEESEEEEEEMDIEDMKQALLDSGEYNKKDLKKMDDDEIEEAYNNLESEEEEGEEESEEEEDDELTSEEIDDYDFDDLEDLVDERELEAIDIEDYDADDKKSVEKLRKAVKKALGLK